MTAGDVLRPAKAGAGGWAMQMAMEHYDLAFGLLRGVWPIARLGKTVVVTRYDDVREVMLADPDFMVPYKAKLDVIMGGAPFFLGMGDTDDYRRDTAAMRMAVRPADIAATLVPATVARAEALTAAAGGRIEVVDFIRTITFEVLCDYFGVTLPVVGDLRVWATRLFEFQFADPGGDPELRRAVDVMAPSLRDHIDGLIAARRGGGPAKDDVLGRCLQYQAEGKPGFTDLEIRSALIGFIVGGLPQPPMVAPNALEQLLRRPAALAGAVAAARQDDDGRLGGHVFEALRFDPLGPALTRTVMHDHRLAEGTHRATSVKAGDTVLAAFSSAMRDGRRVADPERFDPRRPASAYMHFGYGLHTCFGIHINQALIPLMLKPILQRGPRRAPGAEGRLSKRGAFADRLWVTLS